MLAPIRVIAKLIREWGQDLPTIKGQQIPQQHFNGKAIANRVMDIKEQCLLTVGSADQTPARGDFRCQIERHDKVRADIFK